MDFTFFLPTKVIFGYGSLEKLPGEIARLGEGRIFLVTDKVMLKTGITQKIIDKLQGQGYEIFDEVEPEPKIEVAEKVADGVRGSSFHLVLGVGGGSVLDMAKLASCLATNHGQIKSFVGSDKFSKPALPSIVIPTTAGTGSEVTVASMVTIEGHKQWINSPLLLPSTAIVDPELTFTMPKSVTASTGMDALAHCTEALLSNGANIITDATALEGIALAISNLPKAYNNGSDRIAREAMSLGGLLGGVALAARMVYGHSVAYTIATRFNLPHGVSCAIPLPYIVARYSEACSSKMKRLAQAYDVDTETDPVNIGIGIAEKVRGLVSGFGIPTTLRDLGVKEEDLNLLACECLSMYHRPNSPVVFDEAGMLEFYRMMWSGSLQQ